MFVREECRPVQVLRLEGNDGNNSLIFLFLDYGIWILYLGWFCSLLFFFFFWGAFNGLIIRLCKVSYDNNMIIMNENNDNNNNDDDEIKR